MKRVATFAALDSTIDLPILTLARTGLYYGALQKKIICNTCKAEYELDATTFCLHTTVASCTSTSTLENEQAQLERALSALASSDPESAKRLKGITTSCIGRLSGQIAISTTVSSDWPCSRSLGEIPKIEDPPARHSTRSSTTTEVHNNSKALSQPVYHLSQLWKIPLDYEECKRHYMKRLETYTGSPQRTQGPTKEALAWFGYKYCGPNDKVRCTYCNGNLRDWEDGDDPLEEHKRWNSNCPFLPFIMSLHVPCDVKESKNITRPIVTMNIGAETYRIEPREVKARMDGTSARAIMDMGYSRDIVRTVIEEKLRTTGDDFKSVTEMLEAVFQKAEDTKSPGPMGASNWVPNLPIPSVVPSTLDAVLGPDNKEIIKHPDDDFQPTGKKKKKKKSKKPVLPVVVPVVSSETEPVDEEYEQLKAENEELKSNRLCKICMSKEMDTVFLPCGHLMTCNECASKVKDCCMCRTFIRGTVKTFLS